MENTATSVRIAGDAIRALSVLAEKLGQSKAHVIETALKDLEERIFWTEVDEAFRRTAQNPEESQRQQAEFALWDRGAASDFKDEEW